MPFELYPYDHACSPNGLRRGLGLTLGAHGRLLLNADTFAALGHPRHVRLLYVRTAGVIGIQVSRDADWHALRVCSPRSDPRSHRISAKGVCTYFGLHAYLGRRSRGETRDGLPQVSLLGEQHVSAWKERASIASTAAASAARLLVDVLSAPNNEKGSVGMTIVD